MTAQQLTHERTAQEALARPKVLLVGRYPPPIGGITVHVQRLARALTQCCEVMVFDPYGGSAPRDTDVQLIKASSSRPLRTLLDFRQLLCRETFQVIHLHASAMGRFIWAGLPLLALARQHDARVVLTIHSGSLTVNPPNLVSRLVIGRLLENCHRVIAVNKEQARFLINELRQNPRRVDIIPAFLPARAASGSRHAAQILSWRTDGYSVLCSSGSGMPHYGFHLLLTAIRSLRPTSKLALIIALGGRHDANYKAALREQARGLPVVINEDIAPDELAWVMRHSDLYLRCTDRDGDALAVREALHLGTPVIASDCVARPDGVQTYRCGDIQDLVRALQDRADPDTIGEPHPQPDFLADLLQAYGIRNAETARASHRPAATPHQ